MTTNIRFSSTLRFLIGAACVGLALATLNAYATLLNSFFLAVIIVSIASPLLYWLKNKGVPVGLAFLITLLGVLAVLVILVLFLVGSVARLVEAVPAYVAQAEAGRATLQSLTERLGLSTVDVRAALQQIDPQILAKPVVAFLGGLLGSVSNFVVVLLITTFLLVEALGLPAKVHRQMQRAEGRLAPMVQFNHDLRRYVVITTVIGLVTGAGNVILLVILGVDFPILWGILAFILSFIPTVGFWLALIPPMVLALLEFGVVKALIVFVGYVLINGAAENVVKPKFMGEGLDLSPLMIVLSLTFWAAVLGPMGAILGVPLTMAVKQLILEPDEENRWLAELMSAGGGAEADIPVEAAAVAGTK